MPYIMIWIIYRRLCYCNTGLPSVPALVFPPRLEGSDPFPQSCLNIPTSKNLLTLLSLSYIIIFAVNKTALYVRLAQLDRASGYGPEGREFESSIARQKDISDHEMSFLFFSYLFFLTSALQTSHCRHPPYNQPSPRKKPPGGINCRAAFLRRLFICASFFL